MFFAIALARSQGWLTTALEVVCLSSLRLLGKLAMHLPPQGPKQDRPILLYASAVTVGVLERRAEDSVDGGYVPDVYLEAFHIWR